MNVVFTGFEPWDSVVYNPSWDVAQAAAEACNGVAILLPVTFETAAGIVDLLPPAIDRLVHFGVATQRTWLSLERYAHNTDSNRHPLQVDGPAARETRFDLQTWCDTLSARESRDAGTFVCNATYYHSLARFPDALFVHVPPMFPPEAANLGTKIGSLII